MNATLWGAAAGGAALACARAHAQTREVYRLLPSSTLTEVFCLPPCACPYHETVSPLAGTFTLTRTGEDPLYTYYSITSVDWTAGGPDHITGSGTYRWGGEVAITQRMMLDLVISAQAWSFDSGSVGQDPQHPFPQISISLQTPTIGCRQDRLYLLAEPVACYPNCDASTAPPVLNVADFTCFLQRFSAGDPYANCDGSTTQPVLNVADFTCYLQRFAAGCP
jgi:hypothetical protein